MVCRLIFSLCSRMVCPRRAGRPARSDLLLGRILAPCRAPDITDRLLSAARTGGPFLSHLRSLTGYDEPETLSYAISSICPIGADGAQRLQRGRRVRHPIGRQRFDGPRNRDGLIRGLRRRDFRHADGRPLGGGAVLLPLFPTPARHATILSSPIRFADRGLAGTDRCDPPCSVPVSSK